MAKHITKQESAQVQRRARSLLALLKKLSQKYFDDQDRSPSANLYAKGYDELLDLQGELNWWLE